MSRVPRLSATPQLAYLDIAIGRVFIWSRPDGITMRLKRLTNSGGLWKASWELTYTKLGSELAL